MDDIRFVPASTFSLETFADIFTRSFEGYFYPGITTAPILALRTRVEQIDLQRSLVMLVGEEPAGQALLALRAERAWCGGFGVAANFRGRGLSHPLAAAIIDQARQANATAFQLEVLTRNEKAVKTYTRAGLAIRRDLHVFEWRSDGAALPADTALEEASPAELLAHYGRLHPVQAAWQRSLPSLLVRGGMRGLALRQGGELRGYVLYSGGAEAGRIEDLGATDADAAAAVLRGLQGRFPRLLSINEPADSPLTPAFAACGFNESDRQHEMHLAL